MSTWKDRGIVLRTYAQGEYDKTVILLLKGRGKVSVYAKGARRPKSKYFAGTQPFCYSDFVIYDGGGFLSLAQVDIIDNFFGISGDYKAFCNANACVELTDRMMQPAMPSQEQLYLLLRALQAFARKAGTDAGGGAADGILAGFLFKLLQMEGYAPALDECLYCEADLAQGMDKGAAAVNRQGSLYLTASGLACPSCVHKGITRDEEIIKINEGAVFVLRYMLEAGADHVFRLRIADEITPVLQDAAVFFVARHVDFAIKSCELS